MTAAVAPSKRPIGPFFRHLASKLNDRGYHAVAGHETNADGASRPVVVVQGRWTSQKRFISSADDVQALNWLDAVNLARDLTAEGYECGTKWQLGNPQAGVIIAGRIGKILLMEDV